MGTRDIIISLILTGSFVILTDHLFNEESKYCVLPISLKNYAHILDKNKEFVSKDEYNKAVNTIKKAQVQKQKQEHLRMLDTFKGSN